MLIIGEARISGPRSLTLLQAVPLLSSTTLLRVVEKEQKSYKTLSKIRIQSVTTSAESDELLRVLCNPLICFWHVIYSCVIAIHDFFLSPK